MKRRTQFLMLVLSAIACFAYSQGRGMINRVEREKVIAIVSRLKPEMTQANTIKFLLDRGLDGDWSAIGSKPTNQAEMWYRVGTTNIEEFCITFRPKQDMTFEDWRQQFKTNSSFFRAVIYRVEKSGLVEVWSTNAADYIKSARR